MQNSGQKCNKNCNNFNALKTLKIQGAEAFPEPFFVTKTEPGKDEHKKRPGRISTGSVTVTVLSLRWITHITYTPSFSFSAFVLFPQQVT